jgi:hypothetical protein
MKKIFWLCKYCHQHKITDATGKGIFNVTRATSTAINHLAEDKPSHRTTKLGVWPPPRSATSGQKSLKMAMDGGLHISQAVVNAIGNFNVHAFRTAVVQWLVDNNHPLRELETTAFRTMIEHANLEAERALWKNHKSVRSFVIKLYDFIKPQVI